MDLKQAGEHRRQQILELEEWRDKTYHSASIYKERTKRWHNKRLKPKVFNLGDKVLHFKSRVKLFSHGKLRSKWLGPYFVINTSTHGAITIQDDDSNAYKVNSQRIKLFLDYNKSLDKEIDVIDLVGVLLLLLLLTSSSSGL